MLTGKMVRVRFARDRILPYYLDVNDSAWRETAERLLDIFRGPEGHTRGELEEECREAFGDDPGQLVHQGLAKLLEDRCEFDVVSGHPPEELRAAAFRAAAEFRRAAIGSPGAFDRAAVLQRVGTELGLTSEEIDQGLFADLKSEQRLVRFKDISADHLLQRYNVALAQAVLLRAVRLVVTVRGEPPQRYRQLLRRVKFHRLVCEMERLAPKAHRLRLDGPLSLFSATQKYGLQLALFLPAVLLCRDYDLKAEVRWGAQRKPKKFLVGPGDGLVSHYADTGVYVPAELRMFAELFRKKVGDCDLVEETEVFPLGGGYWVPDFRLVHRATGRVVLLEVLGFWRRSSAEQHLARLRTHVSRPFLLAVSDQLHIDEAKLEGLPAGIHRFRNMPLPEEIARLAADLLRQKPTAAGEAQHPDPASVVGARHDRP
jgi:predicted nuclease of restriction endonuclease-like RecB superfamily